ncbi:protein FAM83G-like isoform X2 [Betta splendens]|uniref:Protein FAM83G-like isoform X2 n=1 Tax=Betta splendens TaxID=158456 RepID=A0A6P7NAJ6_BETSP|nr:protein FAM83G-like isoform X2 [Betta splendens]
MALSQLQCLDDNHVNPRTHESKPDFLYCEDQRLALELLLRDGREAFAKFVEARGLRGFLSDPELETLVAAAEPYDPDSELFAGNAEDDEPPLSLHYWPELSDTSAPNMDLGWPDSDSYRGVTRTTVYTQPPLDGQAHVKEVVRKMIAQAQKMIAVVMDVFTDVDIFRDLLDAGFKKKVSVYVLLERTTLPHFLSMCRRANMHAGHLKNLRVRCTEGTEFCTRSCTKVKGRMGHRFMFIDGDKAASGSYSFTWMSSRLDRNILTVITGQAVEAFDRLFRILYVTSSFVDLRQVATEPEPEPEPLPQPVAVVLPSAALARKLHNPKYALVAAASTPPPAENNSPKEPSNPVNSKNPDVPESNKRRQKRASKEAVQDLPPLHPGLTDLEKACLIMYLPTWPEPDPPSDVIGFINIRDASKPTQVHLQRSEMFETSQAIRFSSPFHVPKEILPEVAKPRQLTAKPKQMLKPQPAQDNTKAGGSMPHSAAPAQVSAQPGDIKRDKEEVEATPASGKKSEPARDAAALTTDRPASHDASPHAAGHTPPETHNHQPLCNTHNVATNSPKPEPNQVDAGLNTQCVELRTQSLESNSIQSPHVQVCSNSSSNTQPHIKEITNSHRQAGLTQPQTSETSPNVQASTTYSHNTTSSTAGTQSDRSSSLSENTHNPVTTEVCGPSSSMVSPSTPTVHPSLPPPIPKPRTVQLVIKHDGTSDGKNLPEISVVRRTGKPESAEPLVVHRERDEANVEKSPPENKKETPPELQTSIRPQKETEHTGNPEETPQQKQRVTFQNTKDEEAGGLYDNEAETQAQSDGSITDPPKAGGGNIHEIQTEVDPKRLPQTDSEITSRTQTEQTATTLMDAETPEGTQTNSESVQVPKEKNETPHPSHPRAKEPPRMSPSKMNPQDTGPLETGSSVSASTHRPVSDSSSSQRDDVEENCPQESANHNDGNANMTQPHTDTNSVWTESQRPNPTKPRGGSHTPERPLRLHVCDSHVPDLRSPDSERGLRSLLRSPTPDGYTSCTSTPESRTGPRPFTPDLRTPTPDMSDGYMSLRDDSSTSEEYYECSDSVSHDPESDNHGTEEDRVVSTNTTPVPTTAASPACISNSSPATVLGTADRISSSSDLQSLPGPVSVSSSSVLEQEPKEGTKKKTVNVENGGGEDDEKGRNVAERRTERVSSGTERRGNEEAKKAANPLKQSRDLTEVVEKDKVSQPQAPKRKKALNKSASESLVDGEPIPGKSPTQGTDPKRLSSAGLQPDEVPPEAEEANEDTAARPGGVDKRDRDGQKFCVPRTPVT